MRTIIVIILCLLLKTGLAQIEKSDTSISFTVTLIATKKSLQLDTIDFIGSIYFQINNDSFRCNYSNSTLTINKQRWKELGQICYSKTDSAFLYLEETKKNQFFLKIPFRPFGNDCPCLLEIKSFFHEPEIYECSYWTGWGNMGTLYRANGTNIRKVNN